MRIIALSVLLLGPVGGVQAQARPSFDCSKATHEAEKLVCTSPSLSALDRQLADVYAKALKNDMPAAELNKLKTEQRGWVKGRDECWKDAEKEACIEREYTDRIVTLQARYGLAEVGTPISYSCGTPAVEVYATHVKTNPPTVNLVKPATGEVVTAILRPAGSGSKYEGPFGVLFWEHQGEATLEWPQGKPVKCTRAR